MIFLTTAVLLIIDDDEQFEIMMRAAAQFAANELMALEEDEVLDGDWWVHVTVNINDYHTLGDPCFKNHFRMSRGLFEILVETVGNHLVAKQRLKRERTPLQDIMLMTLWLLATPDSFRSVALRFGVNPGTLYYLYFYVIEALRELAAKFICWPDTEERRNISATVERATGFPGVVGMIDGTHVHVTAPSKDAAQYINRHHMYSINVQAVVDSTLLVRHLHVGEPGNMHDNRVFRRSKLFKDFLTRPPGYIISVDEHILGDGAYTQSDHIMVPFPNNGHLTGAQLNFNKKLSQGRVRVENAFALAKVKWRRLKFMQVRKQEVLVDHVTACFVLHNFIIINGEYVFDEEELGRDINDNQVLGNEIFEDDEDNDLFAGENQQELLRLQDEANVRGIEKRIFYMHHVLPQQ